MDFHVLFVALDFAVAGFGTQHGASAYLALVPSTELISHSLFASILRCQAGSRPISAWVATTFCPSARRSTVSSLRRPWSQRTRSRTSHMNTVYPSRSPPTDTSERRLARKQRRPPLFPVSSYLRVVAATLMKDSGMIIASVSEAVNESLCLVGRLTPVPRGGRL